MLQMGLSGFTNHASKKSQGPRANYVLFQSYINFHHFQLEVVAIGMYGSPPRGPNLSHGARNLQSLEILKLK